MARLFRRVSWVLWMGWHRRPGAPFHPAQIDGLVMHVANGKVRCANGKVRWR